MKKTRTPNNGVPPYSEKLPWLTLVSPEWMLCKDGSLLCAFTYEGVDIDNINEYSVNATLKELQRAIDQLDNRYYMWWTVDKRKDISYKVGDFPNSAGSDLDKSISDGYERGEVFQLNFKVFILYTGETGLYAYMDNVRRLVNDEDKSMIAAMLISLNPTKVGNQALLHDARQLDSNLIQAEEGVKKFLSSLTELKMERLEGWAFQNTLIQSANITVPNDSEYQPSLSAIMDGCASKSDVKFGREVISIGGPTKNVFIANITLQEYSGNTAQRDIDVILALNCEFRITHVVKCLGAEHSRKAVGEVTRFYEMTQTSFLQKAIAKLSNTKAVPSQGKQELYQQCLDAQAHMLTSGLGWVYHSLTITVIESSIAELEKRINEISRLLNKTPFLRERLGLKSSFESCIPGSWTTQKRLKLINTEIAADSLPVITIGKGKKISPYMTDMYSKEMPCLLTTRTRFNTSYHFNPHSGQLGHALIVMPSGNGKTTWVNFCLSQFQRYPNARVIIFDRDWSCRIMTGMVSGKHIDIKSENVKLNPIIAIKEGAAGRLWAREFILRIIEEGGQKTTAEDRNLVDEKLKQLSEIEGPVSLSTVAHVLPPHLHTALQEWLGNGPYGMFDSEEDDLTMDLWTCIEMKELMATPRLARAFLDHTFQVLSKQLGENPTFIYLEEASFLLNNETFITALDDWLKTFRKLNAFVWLTIQSPQSISGIADEKIRATITDNIPNLILGYNKKLENHRNLYKSMFAMTDEQVDLIGELKPFRDYLQISDGFCRVMKTNFTHDMLARLRSEQPYQKLFTEAMNSGKPNWREWYIEQALSRSK